jgi:hypothetical protein
MALEGVPDYLIELLRRTDLQVLRTYLETGEGLAPGDNERLAELLGRWAEDAEFWGMVEQAQPAEAAAGQSLDAILDQELDIVTQGLDGDESLALSALLEAPANVPTQPRDIQQARTTIIIIQQQVSVTQVIPSEPPRRRLKVVRVLRRVFKAAAGGVLVASDIFVVPDPTMLVRIASIAGGVDMIIDAID